MPDQQSILDKAGDVLSLLNEKSVFILGPTKSGKSMLEDMLAVHPAV